MTRVDELEATVADLTQKNAALAADNAHLRNILGRSLNALEQLFGWAKATQDEVDSILDASPPLFDAARKRKAQRSEARGRRARELTDGEALSAAQVGIRVAMEEGRDRPFPERTVRRWLAKNP